MTTRRPSKIQPVKRAVSIQDVAVSAQVSTATVSRVLNNPGMVSPETATRVKDAIAALGYKPNIFAQGLMTRKSHILGVALPDIHGEFYSELLRGADAEARRLGYHLLVSSEAGHAEPDGDAVSRSFGLADGLALMLSEPNEGLLKQVYGLGVPVVVIDTQVNDPAIDCIVVDNTVGAKEATGHLLSTVGADRLYYVGGPRENFDSQERAKAFREVLLASGHTPREEQVEFGKYAVEWGYSWAAIMLRGGRLQNAGALAGNDEIAFGILQASQDAGLSVPGDLRIVGFDDTRLASLVRPGLSSVRVPLAEVGAEAIRMLATRVDEPEREARVARIPTQLVARHSSAAPRR